MNTTLILSATALLITFCLCATILRAWRSWLDFRRLELARMTGTDGPETIGVRIELADVRERLKRLEAIASGVDL